MNWKKNKIILKKEKKSFCVELIEWNEILLKFGFDISANSS